MAQFGFWIVVTVHKNNDGAWFEEWELRKREDAWEFHGVRRNIRIGAKESPWKQ